MARTDLRSDFDSLVRDALAHLHDPTHLESHPLSSLIPRDQVTKARGSARALRLALLDAVDSLRPVPVSTSAHTSRSYQILSLRYLDALDLPEVLDRLALSRSMYFLELGRAVEAVALVLKERWELSVEWGSIGRGLPMQAVSTSLPLPLTSFVGREREMAEVRRLLERTRLLTLTGAGGCGKTRLAIEASHSFLEGYPQPYPDGISLVSLAPVVEPDLVALSVASSLGLHGVAREPISTTLVRHLQPRHALIVLDNCEHLLDACARLAELLLQSCPTISILATSRQPLGIGGETTLHVPSLDLPALEGWATERACLEAVLSHDATRLFVDRASAALPSFEPTISNARSIGEICRRLDGIPLAIELAAARARALSPEQIADRLDHDFHLLTAGSRTALPRQQTLKATLDWSYHLLSEQERLLLRRLSVFVGGFVLEGAEGACAGAGIAGQEVVDLLVGLVDKSLVEADTREGEARYRLLELIRQYAWHRLEESGETEVIRRRHARWLADYTSPTEDEAWGPEEASWLRRMAPERDNVRAALVWCVDHDPRLGLWLVGNTWTLAAWRGVQSDRDRWLDLMLARNPQASPLKTRALAEVAWERFNLGEYERANTLAREHLPSCLRYTEYHSGWLLNALGAAAAEQGDHERARSLLEQAEAIGRRPGNAKSLAYTLCCSGFAAWLAGDYPRARLLVDESLTAMRALGSHVLGGYPLFVAGALASSEGDYQRARAYLEEGLEAGRGGRIVAGMGQCLATRGYVSLREGDHQGARRDLVNALRLVGPPRYRPRISRCLTFLALLAIRERDPSRAARLVAASEAINPHVRHLLPPDQQADLDACLAEAREALGAEAFAEASAEGKGMTMEQAVEYALQDDE